MAALALASMPSWGETPRPPKQDPKQFDALVDEARKYDPRYVRGDARDRDKAVDYYREALKHRPNHPDNLAIEYRIGCLLGSIAIPSKQQRTRRDEAFEVFAAIVKKYPKDNILVARSADYAGQVAGAREWRSKRLQQEATKVIAEGTPELAADLKVLENPAGPSEARSYFRYSLESCALAYRKAGGKREGDEKELFGYQWTVFRTASKHYVKTFGSPRTPEGKAACEWIVSTFPETPMAREAKGFLARGTTTPVEVLERRAKRAVKPMVAMAPKRTPQPKVQPSPKKVSGPKPGRPQPPQAMEPAGKDTSFRRALCVGLACLAVLTVWIALLLLRCKRQEVAKT